MPSPRLNPDFVVKLAIKNDRGQVVGEREFVTYPGLLALAHELGLEEISTSILQMPSDTNGQTAVVLAVARGKPGTFTGLGDASVANTHRRVAPHLLRVAETRAKARALRDLTNVALVALEELADDEVEVVRAPPAPPRRLAKKPMVTDEQKRSLFRLAVSLGHSGDDAVRFLRERFGFDPAHASEAQARAMLERLTDEHRRSGRGVDAAE